MTTGDLRVAMEQVSGRSLGRFFSLWADQAGHPEFESSWSYDQERGRILLSLNQVHGSSSGLPNKYQGTIHAEVRTDQGSQVHKLRFSERRSILEIPAPNFRFGCALTRKVCFRANSLKNEGNGSGMRWPRPVSWVSPRIAYRSTSRPGSKPSTTSSQTTRTWARACATRA